VEPLTVSLIHLIAHPERYDGKRVRVAGFLCLEFEGTCLFLHREDRDHCLFQNALWVSVRYGDLTQDRAKELHHRYVTIVGTFRRDVTGHLAVCRNGGICEVSEYRLCLQATDTGCTRFSTTETPSHGAN
jgi:hypothetical protein